MFKWSEARDTIVKDMNFHFFIFSLVLFINFWQKGLAFNIMLGFKKS
jgi:hypothetical protein